MGRRPGRKRIYGAEPREHVWWLQIFYFLGTKYNKLDQLPHRGFVGYAGLNKVVICSVLPINCTKNASGGQASLDPVGSLITAPPAILPSWL